MGTQSSLKVRGLLTTALNFKVPGGCVWGRGAGICAVLTQLRDPRCHFTWSSRLMAPVSFRNSRCVHFLLVRNTLPQFSGLGPHPLSHMFQVRNPHTAQRSPLRSRVSEKATIQVSARLQSLLETQLGKNPLASPFRLLAELTSLGIYD